MNYFKDLRGSWEKVVGHHTALYPRESESLKQRTFNVDYAVNFWIESGMPAEKINLGLATYGRSFKLAEVSKNEIGCPAIGPARSGKVKTVLFFKFC